MIQMVTDDDIYLPRLTIEEFPDQILHFSLL